MARADEPPTSHYPKRKRSSISNGHAESDVETPMHFPREEQERTALPSASNKAEPRIGRGNVKGVLVGHWRDSLVPENENKHAVIGFINADDKLRFRIQPTNKAGETIPDDHPLPPGSGGSWVRFDRVYFCAHLVGLNRFQVKEYVRLRAAAADGTDEERSAAETEAVSEATKRGTELLHEKNPFVAPLIAHGAISTGSTPTPPAGNCKRRRISSSFVAIAPQDDTAAAAVPALNPLVIDPLHGTRPTAITIGIWRGSSEALDRNCHAVHGILDQNDMLRLEVVRKTRDDRYIDGNFHSASSALYIQFKEVELEPHLKRLTKVGIREYCRIRQRQVDQGETVDERAANEQRAAKDASARAKTCPRRNLAGFSAAGVRNSGRGSGSQEPRQLRHADFKADLQVVAATNRPPCTQNGKVLERVDSLAGKHLLRVEAAQGRADRFAVDASAGTEGITVPNPHTINGSGSHYDPENIERLNHVWARQESRQLRAGPEDAKIYDGVKYERKPNGPLMGKLVSQGTIIVIDGEEYVEYRVLTRPSFF